LFILVFRSIDYTTLPLGSMIKNAFKYEFRMWSIGELREALLEAGFEAVHVWISSRTKSSESPHSSSPIATEQEYKRLNVTSKNDMKLPYISLFNAYLVAIA
jgi:hypothetical protein